MSHPRTCKTAIAGDGPRERTPTRAAGDVVDNTNGANQPQRVRSKNKLPKSVRYDLENALVGLCDVWFENIKPHLIRNNIKLHVHNDVAAPEASGDYERLPARAPGCSHIDPGAALDHRRRKIASYVDSSPTRPPASRAPSHKQPAWPPRLPQTRSPLSPVTPMHTTKPNPQRSNEKKSHSRKRQKGAPVSLQPNWRVPRLCRTYSILSPIATPRNQRRIRTASPSQLRMPKPYTHYLQSASQKQKGMFKHKFTQTEWLSKTKAKPSATTKSQAPAYAQLPENRCLATTALAGPIRHDGNLKRTSRHSRNVDENSLFKSDLISIISEKNDKRIKLLFKSPTRDEYPSMMNLAMPPCDPKRDLCTKKVKPWR